ncbi:MAG: hypothetical protein JO033_20525 [Acidobacteriaceae bacterium]|nr:hypothetical protein [Acidobacteriaceae bacterium]
MALSSEKKAVLKDLALSLSIANLCFLFIWLEVLNLAGDDTFRYYEAQPPGFDLVGALILDISAVGVVLFASFRARRAQRAPLKWTAAGVIAVFSMFALYQLQRSITDYMMDRVIFTTLFICKLIIAAVAGILLLWSLAQHFRRSPKRFLRELPNRLARVGSAVFVVLFPLFPLLMANAVIRYESIGAPLFRDHSPAPMLTAKADTPRVIWIIFDEMDMRMAFEAPPQRINLREFNRLKNQAIFGARVITPNRNTTPSMNSLLLGVQITEFNQQTRELLFKTAACSHWQRFSSHANVFSRAREAGFNTGLSGWHHPYCRLIAQDLNDCAWVENPWYTWKRYLQPISFWQKAESLIDRQARHVPGARNIFGIDAESDALQEYCSHDISALRTVLANGYRMLRDPHLNLVLIHLPIPHPPGIWDARRGVFVTTGNSNYIDNLQLSDMVLGQIRRVLEQSGEWDRSAILVSSDHPYRVAAWQFAGPDVDLRSEEVAYFSQMRQQPYVPFLLKLPNQKSPVSYDREFNSVITADLLLALLKKELTTTTEVIQWVNAHATDSLTFASSCR